MERRHLATATAHYLHIAAAAHYMAEAGDVEMGYGALAHIGGGHGALAYGELGHGDGLAYGELGHGDGLGHGDDGDGLGSGDDGDGLGSGNDGDGLGNGSNGDGLGNGNGGDADEELKWSMQDLYDLLLLLASYVPPTPVYRALPQDVVEGLAWTWVVLVYGVFLAAAVTTFCVRVLGLGKSTRCLPTTLRVLLLSATVVSEVFAAVYLMPATTLTTVGTCFSVVLLLAAHLVAARRRR